MNETIFTTIASPLGRLLAVSDGQSLTHLDMQGGRRPRRISPSWRADDTAFGSLRAQFEEYFAGDRRAFDLALAPAGNAFELRVWAALVQIPYGETASYGEIAQRIGAPGAARAVGLANGRNPIAVIIPCHRVIGSNGSLTGYGGGLDRKRLLLDLESGVLPLAPATPLAPAAA
jgi:methylated-DNA-[protein]-cysteine S-methyltransferase